MRSPYGLDIIERCDGCRRRGSRGFCDLPDAALRALDAVKFTTLYPRGALLFVEGQPARGVYVLCSGRVKLSAASRDARVIITRIVRAGEILGLCAALSGAPYEVTVGQHTGASRETVTRLFSEFKHENLIQVRGATLLLNDRSALEALANY